MYLGWYCKTQACGQFHLVHYIGFTSQTTFARPDGWWDYECPRSGHAHRYIGADLAPSKYPASVNETWPHCAGEYWPHLGVS
jgi:hypothetical protein